MGKFQTGVYHVIALQFYIDQTFSLFSAYKLLFYSLSALMITLLPQNLQHVQYNLLNAIPATDQQHPK